ncbi:hypothetical protein V9T40_007869 [Parthenolecanium corni]|uniref:Kinase suppressor of Ras 2 n=1 Tax=Parthenolecanium corni TaxID=536013 RepID=A0AAN9TK59_9HEMI
MAEEDQDVKPLEILQSMIDIFAERLVGLRTQCSTSNELTQSEIRTLEGKLIKLFSRQYVIRVKLRDKINATPSLQNIPSLEQWLQVVGLCQSCIQHICSRVKTIESLLEKPQYKLKNFLSNCIQLEEEYRRLSTALKNLKRYIDTLTENKNDANSAGTEITSLHWDSWNWQCSGQTSTVISQEYPNSQFNGHYSAHGDHSTVNNIHSGCSSTPPILSPPITPIHKLKQEEYVQKSPGSISDHCRYPAQGRDPNYQDRGVDDADPTISKSRSHESQLFNLTSSNGKNPTSSNFTFPCENEGSTTRTNRRARLPTVPGTEHSSPATSLYSSPSRSPPFLCTVPSSNSATNSLLTVTLDSSPLRNIDLTSSSNASVIDSPLGRSNNLPTVPRSPKTPTSVSRVMAHDIAHRFTKRFSINKPCDYCCKPIIMNTGLKCKECRYRCHIDCESKVPPSCGLPEEFVNIFKSFVDNNNHHSSVVNSNGAESSPVTIRHMAGSNHPSPAINNFLSHIERRSGSDSATSSHSSAPSSPALFTVPNQQIPATANAILSSKQKFDFSADVINQEADLCSSLNSDPIDSSSITNETLYDKSVNREDSQDSQNWDSEYTDKVWPRQYSVSMKEWEIPWDELKMGEKLGTGHFGTVYSGYWHGDVAVKVLNMDYLADEKMLENFKSEVSTFRKTRHDNLVLFMGACMKPPRLAIVTSMVHGITLYKYIHLRRDKFSMGKTTIIAQQISQGMGYLHAKNIVHKDLRTKNIFLEKERVIITDFGLFSVTKLCFKNRTQDGLIIPPGWLCYLAPELMRSLKVHIKPDDEHLPFSKASDVYAFGTVWYELLCGEWPFTTQDPEAVIWQVGKGMKPSLANLEASRDVKDILMQCWMYMPNRRPDFTSLLKTLEKLPKKKLARSPSHPVHLSRSAESMF